MSEYCEIRDSKFHMIEKIISSFGMVFCCNLSKINDFLLHGFTSSLKLTVHPGNKPFSRFQRKSTARVARVGSSHMCLHSTEG